MNELINQTRMLIQTTVQEEVSITHRILYKNPFDVRPLRYIVSSSVLYDAIIYR